MSGSIVPAGSYTSVLLRTAATIPTMLRRLSLMLSRVELAASLGAIDVVTVAGEFAASTEDGPASLLVAISSRTAFDGA